MNSTIKALTGRFASQPDKRIRVLMIVEQCPYLRDPRVRKEIDHHLAWQYSVINLLKVYEKVIESRHQGHVLTWNPEDLRSSEDGKAA